MGRLPVAMEGAFGWPWIADLLEKLDLEPHFGLPATHPARPSRWSCSQLVAVTTERASSHLRGCGTAKHPKPDAF